MKEIRIDSEYIKLDQLLKLANIVSSGGEAKVVIMQGDVKLNGKVESQRGKKIRSGDIVSANGISVKVI